MRIFEGRDALMMSYVSIYRTLQILTAQIKKKPLALSDAGDVDGIVSATLFKISKPNAEIVLAHPQDVLRSPILRRVYWDFVADLPCPGKARLRADHHVTNSPCADEEFYDPSAPASAFLAMKALSLDNNPLAVTLVNLAVETDTADIRSQEALLLDAAVKGAGYRGKLRLVELLAREGLEALKREEVREWISRHEEMRKRTEKIAEKIPVEKVTIVAFKKDLGIAYRYLTILLERRGAEFTLVIVPRGLFKFRLYAGAQPSSSYDASVIASSLGGGGHKYAAGALFNATSLEKALKRVLSVARTHYVIGDDAIYVANEEDIKKEKIIF
jgi:hypothetical protein